MDDSYWLHFHEGNYKGNVIIKLNIACERQS